ncbi:hypothetical protein FSP39_018682 [Pinctada imbricata]|uniref:G-protein coupled receptors family 1 profile domain-containing protein n=1 Tax=Pinctada imbricata TaxID=66713 RepID=A0AA89C1Z2_PINIB|nr:hypothetical protein FSP39_018682 [Pinctada imbricata]
MDSRTDRLLQGISLIIICLLALIGNFSVLSMCLSKNMRTTTHSFTYVLAVADLLVTSLSMPMTAQTLIMGRWLYSDVVCHVWGLINLVTISASVMSLCNIAISRYVMVCRPHTYRRMYTPGNAAVFVLVASCLALVVSLTPVFGWSQIWYNPNQYICINDWANSKSFSKFFIVGCFGTPLVVMLVCNTLILRQIRRNNTRVDRRSRIRLSTLVQSISGLTVRPHLAIINARGGARRQDEIPLEDTSDLNVNLSVTVNVQSIETLESISDITHRDDQGEGTQNRTDSHGTVGQNEEHLDRAEKMSDAAGVRNSSKESTTVAMPRSVHHGSNNTYSGLQKLHELRLRRMLFVAPIMYTIFWTPFCLSVLTSVYSEKNMTIFHCLTLLIGYLNCCVNPVIYGLLNTNFNRKCRDFCRGKSSA